MFGLLIESFEQWNQLKTDLSTDFLKLFQKHSAIIRQRTGMRWPNGKSTKTNGNAGHTLTLPFRNIWTISMGEIIIGNRKPTIPSDNFRQQCLWLRYDQRAMDNTRDSWALNSSNTVPQGFRGGRRLPPTPKTPSTLQPFMTSLGSSDYQSNQKGTIEQNNQR